MAESSSSSTTERMLPVSLNQEYRVKLGRSFTFPKENAFHTIKYDFKPKSVDSTQPGRMKVSGDEVSVSLPVTQAESADDVVLFKGAKRTCAKECVLIINTVTGEAILEKISNTVQLKGVRDPKKKKQPRSVSPLLTQAKTNKPVAMETATPPKQSHGKKTKRPKKANRELKPPPPPNSHGNSKPSASLLSLPNSISPLRSNNPTPEPNPEPPSNIPEPPPNVPEPPPFSIPVPPLPPKRRKESSSSNSSSSDSSSNSSDSESEVDFTAVNSTLSQPMMSMPQFTSMQPVAMTMQPVAMTMQPVAMNMLPNTSMLSSAHGSHMTSNAGHVMSNNGTNNMIETLSDGSSSSSSSSSDGEDSSSSESPQKNKFISFPPAPPAVASGDVRQRSMSVLKKDLELSDSDSD